MRMIQSRYHRPRVPSGQLVLQARDREILHTLFAHRYLSAEHIRLLHFADSSLKRSQRRLRLLWVHRFVDRVFVPFVLDGRGRVERFTAAPLYTLARRGAEVVAEERGLDLADIPHTPTANARGYATLQHHLVATDLLVALLVACRGRPDVSMASVEQESGLRRRLAQLPADRRRLPMPDGAFTLSYATGERLTFYIEVVRALAKGGNQSIQNKLERYVESVRAGRFRKAFGHDRVRAVLFATTSSRRAEHYLALARTLPSSTRLFWFGVYAPMQSLAFDPRTVLDQPWQSLDGFHTLTAPTAPPRPQAHSFIH